MAAARNKRMNSIVDSKTVTMSTAVQSQNEVTIPNFGDVVAVEVSISQSTTGTLTTAKTLDYSVDSLVVKTKSGQQVLQAIRGIDLLFIERMRNKGVNRTIATTSSSAQTENFYIPINVEAKDLEGKIQLSVAPYSAMAASGATGGSITYTLTVWYNNTSELTFTEKISRTTLALASGNNVFGPYLPQQTAVQAILFSVGTESNITNITFTGDGSKEIDNVTTEQLKGIDNANLVSGHVTGTFALYNVPFFCSGASRLDMLGAGSDTVQLFVISVLPAQSN